MNHELSSGMKLFPSVVMGRLFLSPQIHPGTIGMSREVRSPHFAEAELADELIPVNRESFVLQKCSLGTIRPQVYPSQKGRAVSSYLDPY